MALKLFESQGYLNYKEEAGQKAQPRLERASTKPLATYRFLTENDERGRYEIVIRL